MRDSEAALDPALLDILACQACHGRLELQQSRLICLTCKRRYPIEDGIPILLVDEAELPDEANP